MQATFLTPQPSDSRCSVSQTLKAARGSPFILQGPMVTSTSRYTLCQRTAVDSGTIDVKENCAKATGERARTTELG